MQIFVDVVTASAAIYLPGQVYFLVLFVVSSDIIQPYLLPATHRIAETIAHMKKRNTEHVHYNMLAVESAIHWIKVTDIFTIIYAANAQIIYPTFSRFNGRF